MSNYYKRKRIVSEIRQKLLLRALTKKTRKDFEIYCDNDTWTLSSNRFLNVDNVRYCPIHELDVYWQEQHLNDIIFNPDSTNTDYSKRRKAEQHNHYIRFLETKIQSTTQYSKPIIEDIPDIPDELPSDVADMSPNDAEMALETI